MKLDDIIFTNLFYVILITFFSIYMASKFALRNYAEKLFFTTGILGLCLFSGIGASYKWVDKDYIYYYSFFIVFLSFSFITTTKLFSSLNFKLRFVKDDIELIFGNTKVIIFVLFIYLFSTFFPLIYPENKIYNLITPPSPDILSVWNMGLGLERDLISRLNEYISLIIFPFYLISLYFFRKNSIALLVLIFVPIYFKYCAFAYVGRSDIVVALLLFVFAQWLLKPSKRLRIILASCIIVPVLFLIFSIYSQTRMGITKSGESFEDLLLTEIYTQTSFPEYFKNINYSPKRANLTDYFTWMITLPFPSIIFGEKSGTRINYEIATIIEGKKIGTEGFTVTLAGPITESVYIYGNDLYLLHAVFIGSFFGLLCVVSQSVPALIFVYIFFMSVFSYVFARAGVAAALSVGINQFLSLWFVIVVVYLHKIKNFKPKTSVQLDKGCP